MLRAAAGTFPPPGLAGSESGRWRRQRKTPFPAAVPGKRKKKRSQFGRERGRRPFPGPSSFRRLLSGGCRELFSVTAAGKRRTGKADQGRPTDQQQRAGSVFRRRRFCFCVGLALTLVGGDRWPPRLHMWTTVRMLFLVAGAGRNFGAADERRGPDDSHYRQPAISQTQAELTLVTHSFSFAGRFFWLQVQQCSDPERHGGGWRRKSKREARSSSSCTSFSSLS
ncbi:hypothetical protein MRX96_015443 [Rhipicephalus microplus]